MVDSRDGSRFTKGLFKLLFSLSLVDSRVCSPEGKAMEDFAVEALQLLEFVLQWEGMSLFCGVLSAMNKMHGRGANDVWCTRLQTPSKSLLLNSGVVLPHQETSD